MFMPFLKDKSGATAIEYGLIVGFIFLAIVTGIHYYTDQTGVLYNKIGTAVAGASH